MSAYWVLILGLQTSSSGRLLSASSFGGRGLQACGAMLLPFCQHQGSSKPACLAVVKPSGRVCSSPRGPWWSWWFVEIRRCWQVVLAAIGRQLGSGTVWLSANRETTVTLITSLLRVLTITGHRASTCHYARVREIGRAHV